MIKHTNSEFENTIHDNPAYINASYDFHSPQKTIRETVYQFP